MTPAVAKSESRMRGAAAWACALAGAVVFLGFGNATRGYIDTPSVVAWWVRQWLNPASETEHGWIVLALAGWLCWRNLRASRRGQPGAGISDASALRRRDDVIVPALAMAAALALHGIGFVAQQTRVSIVAMLLFAWGALALANRRWARAAAFPLGFMVFAIPLNVLDSLGFWLRLGVIETSTALAHAVGIDVVRSGTQLFAPDGHYRYDVAAACSGVRSMMALLALALLIGYLEFRAWWRRAAMLALAVPLTFLGNLARIGAIILAAQLGGQRWGERAHDAMGFGVFVIVLGGVWLAANWLGQRFPEAEKCHLLNDTSAEGAPRSDAGSGGGRGDGSGSDAGNGDGDGSVGAGAGAGAGEAMRDGREAGALARGPRVSETAAGEKRRQEPREPGFARTGPAAAAVLAALVVVLAAAEIAGLAHLSRAPARTGVGVRLAADGAAPADLPAFVGTDWIGRRADVTAVERDMLPADTGFARRTYLNLRDPSHAVFVSIVLSGRDRTSIHRPELCLVGQGWTIAAPAGLHRFRVADGGTGVEATLLRTTRTLPGSRTPAAALVAYWFVDGDAIVPTHAQRLWRDACNRVFHGRADRWAYVLMQADATDGEAAALARMQAVFDGTWPSIRSAPPVGRAAVREAASTPR